MIGEWSEFSGPEEDALWDLVYKRLEFHPSGGKPVPVITDPTPSITFDLRPVWSPASVERATTAQDAIEAAARRAFVWALGDDVELAVLDWQHDSYRVTPAGGGAEELSADGFPMHPTVVPNGDYYIFTTLDLSEGTFGHPWEPSLCVFGPKMVASLGVELATWLPILRGHHSS